MVSPDTLAVTSGSYVDAPSVVTLQPPNGEQEMALHMTPGSSNLGAGDASSTGCPCLGSTQLSLTFDKNVQAGVGSFVVKLTAQSGSDNPLDDVVIEEIDVGDSSKVQFSHTNPDPNANTASNAAYAANGTYFSDGGVRLQGSVVSITLSDTTLRLEGRTYYCTFASGVVFDQQVSPNPFPGFADSSSWSFRVAPDRTSPAIVSTEPVTGTTGMSLFALNCLP